MIRKTVLYVALSLGLFTCATYSNAGFFGYYHTSPAAVKITKDHTNLVHVQAANIEEPLDEIMELHPTAKLMFEFHALNMTPHPDGYNKCRLSKVL